MRLLELCTAQCLCWVSYTFQQDAFLTEKVHETQQSSRRSGSESVCWPLLSRMYLSRDRLWRCRLVVFGALWSTGGIWCSLVLAVAAPRTFSPRQWQGPWGDFGPSQEPPRDRGIRLPARMVFDQDRGRDSRLGRRGMSLWGGLVGGSDSEVLRGLGLWRCNGLGGFRKDTLPLPTHFVLEDEFFFYVFYTHLI